MCLRTVNKCDRGAGGLDNATWVKNQTIISGLMKWICCNRNCKIIFGFATTLKSSCSHKLLTGVKFTTRVIPEMSELMKKRLLLHTSSSRPTSDVRGVANSERRTTPISVTACFSPHRPGWRWQEHPQTDDTVTTPPLQKLSATPYFPAPTRGMLSEAPHENPIIEALAGRCWFFCRSQETGEKDIAGEENSRWRTVYHIYLFHKSSNLILQQESGKWQTDDTGAKNTWCKGQTRTVWEHFNSLHTKWDQIKNFYSFNMWTIFMWL